MATAKQDRDFIDSVVGQELLDNAVDWVRRNLEPSEVFDDATLAGWAKANGYIEEE